MLSFLLQSVLSLIQPTTLAAIGVVAALLFVFRRLEFTSPEEQNHPPFIPSVIPFLGQAVTFGKDPIKFLLTSHQKVAYGDVFSFTMLGKTFTYLIGSDASALFFNSKNEDLNAEDVYSKLVIPIFGKGVAYDAPHSVFLEQKKLLKLGLTIAHFRQYVPLIQEETEDYFRCWGDSDTKDIFVALSELTILTSSRCLHGPEIRQKMDEHVAQLYIDLDGGFSHLAWLLPAWVPLPSFQKRDKARLEMNRIFGEVIKQRREHPNECSEEDILSILINATYKDGRSIPDGEITGMLIAILLAGQHTSSTTGAWLGFFLARDKALQERVYREQLEVCGEDLPPLSFDQLKDLSLLDRCVRETLRLQPPIMTMMRMVRTPQKVGDFTIPAGHQICVSPTINQRLKETWKDPETFNPDRYVKPGDKSEKFAYIPFGAGRHRCIGESFAYVQMKTIWSVLLRKYEFDLCDGYFPPVNYSTMVHTPTRPMIQYRRRKNNREST